MPVPYYVHKSIVLCTVRVGCRRKQFTFAISSPDELLVLLCCNASAFVFCAIKKLFTCLLTLQEYRDFGPFLLLWPWPWPDDLHIQTWSVSPGDKPGVLNWTFCVKDFESYRLTDRQTDRQTRPKLYTTPLCWWSTTSYMRDMSCWFNS